MKKHLLSALAGAVLVLSLLTGCQESASGQNSPVQEPEPDDFGVYDMAYVLSTKDEFLDLLEECVLESAYDYCMTMETYYAGEDSEKMVECVREARNAGKQAVLINLNSADNASACIKAAGDMKVVFINRLPDDFSILNENAVAVSSNEYSAGVYQGRYLADYFREQGKDEISYVLLRGTEGLVHTELRTKGALETLENAGFTLDQAAVIHAGYSRTTARDSFADLIPDLEYDCIISNNDAMAIGAITALENEGMDPGSVPIVGIDATEAGRNAIRKGEMAMTVFQSAHGQANAAVLAAINMLEDVDFSEGTECDVSGESKYVLYYPFIPVTIDNVDSIE